MRQPLEGAALHRAVRSGSSQHTGIAPLAPSGPTDRGHRGLPEAGRSENDREEQQNRHGDGEASSQLSEQLAPWPRSRSASAWA